MKKFSKLDESFICEYCNKKVEKLNYTSRDHCPFCLFSKHVDILPGDRSNTCKGLLKPISVEKFKDSFPSLSTFLKNSQAYKVNMYL